ncbi:MAG: divalent-cation tolerance protein CutA [Planctomycetota bacterium]
MSDQLVLILTSGDDREVLDRIARTLIERRLAACCQLGAAVTSYYRWEEKIESAPEWTMTIKTSELRVKEISELISAMHNYDLPEVVSVPVTGGSEKYLHWVAQQSAS